MCVSECEWTGVRACEYMCVGVSACAHVSVDVSVQVLCIVTVWLCV